MKILTSRAHCGHQYELWKLEHDFTCVSGIGGVTNEWGYSQRPLHDKVQFIDRKKVNPKDYDLCIIHFDEFCVNPVRTLIDREWDKPIQYFLGLDLPKVAVCHGTPRIVEIENSLEKDTLDNDIIYDEKTNNKIRELFKDVLVICNSYQARKEWQFNKSKVIWHGFDPNEFTSTTYALDGYHTPSQTLIQRPRMNGYHMFNRVIQYLQGIIDLKPLQINNVSPEGLASNEYAKQQFERFRSDLSKYSYCFNTTIRSPMPKNRGEAMMCGIVIVTPDNHDASMFLENYNNGFFSNDPQQLSNFILELHHDKNMCREIGQRGRKTAINIFHIDRYLNDWRKTLKEI